MLSFALGISSKENIQIHSHQYSSFVIKMMNLYQVIGLMSGTSLDGLDIAHCIFTKKGKKWDYRIQKAETVVYSHSWKERLKAVETGTAETLVELDRKYGHYTGGLVKKFIIRNKIKPDLIASHGHTIFHQPEKRFTFQLGSGAAISAECGVPVVCDFRSMDVALNGQGAPLVPIGDRLLFSQYTYCLNIGGIANISFEKNNRRIAFDCCPANMVLNELSRLLGKEYDDKGILAGQGKLDKQLLDELNQLPFYRIKGAKSLGKEWFLSSFLPLLNASRIPVKDKLRTVCEHIAMQIARAIPGREHRSETLLITGGGAYNDYLIARIKAHANCVIIIPNNLTIQFKEALIFGFLGVLCFRKETNVLKSVTGSSRNNVGGCIYHG